MLTTLEAEVDVDGNVRLLEPIKLTKRSRAIVTLLEGENLSRKVLSDEEKRLAEENFARWIGSVNSGNPRSADDEQIDADLARQGAGEDGAVNGGGASEDVRRRRMEWLKSNRERYGGQYVVLDEDKLLGVASSYPEGQRIAMTAGVPDAFVVYLSKPDETGYMGGW